MNRARTGCDACDGCDGGIGQGVCMRRVILESPYAGDVEANVAYGYRCLRDCLDRGEAPIASHLLFPNILDDKVPDERKLGIAAGLAWAPVADAMVIYIDRKISNGMRAAMREAQRIGLPVELRSIEVIEMGGAA
jgi:hypothetical protein